ncbi:MAG: hypothetical protein J6U23_00690 [Clostridiales bacterium]|nr:hypothetical protein [Clostridiales bacterium]
MFNLIRAEFYRFKNSGGYLYLMILASVLALSLTFIDNGGAENSFDFPVVLSNVTQMTYNMALLTCGTLLTIFIGVSYNNRMSYYEIMAGNPPHKIILSKTLSTGFLSSVIVYVPTAILLLVSFIKNGKGSIEDPLMVFIILFVVTLHTMFSFILYAMLGRNLVIASFIPYIRLGILDLIVYLLIAQEFSEHVDNKLLYITTNSQMAHLMNMSGDSKLLLIVLLSSVVECAVLYILVYFVYKNRLFK